ncbi:30S ribosomal protein S18 [Candidatus Shapirobacteria bacterium RIFOXYD1_FULL_38_32]|uniref:Small ribosomal subunit protein bS18 n=3 Tax=Patescibacteria group TaxID=1783273 RepID=A0A0G0JNF8_9BACT|nr:MAG: 30S ribosomal protein S18 [Candidatus Shapirobacteria bacterium GW2011_GWE2_38_30]KKQ90220.1 MAG: 30S ribosomal protein S18 [Candidatus Shapirobacteria bacterium GW2011_GWE1_38_92]OGJ06471.1 MAG: 30S ribosomal protein S18 [Candidatus Nomurabacteria bacterium RIFOXYA1_FULL_35_17]OGL57716.1 MAG: 30S ribosomal protein S18 [Candidatus Shapirobacteria bacterium RIFOXYC1_FULL_38_24]OGL58028.1 MAG: 30S ribosomal protein S18 [Candidatus Shapirobacteria bacterium RIFOXYD1_FULL_38_32]HAP37339.1 
MAKTRGRKKNRKNRLMSRDKVCVFCKEKKLYNWSDQEKLVEFLSPRSRILSRSVTGVCVKHQKMLTESIKRARHLALLPFVTKQ